LLGTVGELGIYAVFRDLGSGVDKIPDPDPHQRI
jgi:hypothetical protein